MLGETISHYRILEKLGQGGVGEVYLAEDTRLGRKVALKFLAPELARHREALIRFRNEARAAAELSHPNIATIHDFDEVDGTSFLVLEYLEGQTLQERIAQGPLPIDEVLRIGRAVAAGLAEAHARGIVHRDIKSANIMLTDKGEVKILDFGLARREDATQLTAPGSTLGTIAYMSPEQARGETVDERSDLWSLGVVLYECLTGKRPFAGEEVSILRQIQAAEPSPPTGLRSGIPLPLEHVVLRCLDKDTSLRYQHADDLSSQLAALRRDASTSTTNDGTTATTPPRGPGHRRWAGSVIATLLILLALWMVFDGRPIRRGATTDSDAVMIAVLPFENLGEPGDAYFADGVTDEILVRLCSVPDLGVIARNSSFQFRESDASMAEIAERLGVEYVLHGSIRWRRTPDGEDQVRVTPRLTQAHSGRGVWGDVLDGTLEDIFEIQARIGERVAAALRVNLPPSSTDERFDVGTRNIEAYLLYLRAESQYDRQIAASSLEAERLLLEVIRLDPGFAAAHARLSVVYTLRYSYGMDRDDKGASRAWEALEAARAIDPNLFEVLLAEARYWYHVKADFGSARSALDRALERRPQAAEAVGLLGTLHKRRGEFHEAIRLYRRQRVLDPLSGAAAIEEAICRMHLRQYREAEEALRSALVVKPDDVGLRAWLCELYMGWGDHLDQVRPLAMALPSDHQRARATRLRYYQLAGEYEAAIAYLTAHPASEGDALSRAGDLLSVATLHRQLGNLTESRNAALEAKPVFESQIQATPDVPVWHVVLGEALALLGQKEEALEAIRKAISLRPEDPIRRYRFTKALAYVCILVGELDAAVEHLEYLFSVPSGLMPTAVRDDPGFAPLRTHPRFIELVGDRKT